MNNRDLKTFDVSQETSLALVERIPSSVVRVTESGISTPEDIARLRQAGFDAFLIGESLMRQPDPGEALAALLKGAAGKAAVPRNDCNDCTFAATMQSLQSWPEVHRGDEPDCSKCRCRRLSSR